MKKTTVLTFTTLVLIVILLSGCFTQEKAAEFEVSVLSVSQSSLTVGESTTVEVAVENLGETRTSHEVELKVDGEIHDSKEITLDSAETFTVSFEKEGKYEVSVADKKSTITVTAAEPATPADLLKMATDFFLLLDNEEYTAAVKQFDATMENALPVEKLREVWKTIIAKQGYLNLWERAQYLRKMDLKLFC